MEVNQQEESMTVNSIHNSRPTITVCALALFLLAGLPSAFGQIHGINMGAGNQVGIANDDLVNKAANTGVQWMYVPVFWSWLEPNGSGSTYWGPYAGRYHDYDPSSLAQLDTAVNGFQGRGINVVIQLRSQPKWAGGSPCDVTATGGPPSCGIIYSGMKDNYRANFADLAYFLAGRYPSVVYWAIGNEPNLDYYFSPQTPLLYQSSAAEYMDLMLIPATNAIQSRIPGASVFGPELAACNNGAGDSCSNYDHNWQYTTNWNYDWARTLLLNYPQYFPRFTLHNYGGNDQSMRTAVGSLWDHTMVPLGQQRPIWTTEFNFNSGTCGNSEREIADWTCKNYKYMTWERAFYFDLRGNGCFSLLMSDSGNTPKSFLYPAFGAIVSNTYFCQ
jgi:hypothetical protein